MPASGSNLSEESIKKMQDSKQKYLLAKYNWDLIEPYLDVTFNNGSGNRKLKFISFREFKKLVLDGSSLRDIKKTGISRHLIQFMSNMSQGRINLDRKIFLQEYKDGLSLEEIGKKYNIIRDDITLLRQLYDIKATGAKYQEARRNDILLTQRQKEILYGSMMGDAKRTARRSVGFGHGEPQKDYLLWKFQEFESISSLNSLKACSYLDKRSGNFNTTWRFYTISNKYVEECVDDFYFSGKKEITKSILDNLTPLSIAVWYMDDGRTSYGYRTIDIRYNNDSPIFTFCTESFSYESMKNIQNWFLEKWKLNTHLKEKQLSTGIGYRITISHNDIDRFVDLIKPYMLPMFMYKIDYVSYIESKRNSEKIDALDIIRCPVGDEFKSLTNYDKDNWVNKVVSYWRKKGFYYLIKDPKYFKRDMNLAINHDSSVVLKDDYIAFSSTGNKFLMAHFPHFWEARAKGRKSPIEVFENDRYLTEITREIIQEGKKPKPVYILRKLRNYRGNKVISGFMPCVAKAIYERYCEYESKVLDFCSGYGGRLFGAMACDKVKSYTGIEVNFKSYINLQELSKNLRLYGNNIKDMTIFNQDSVAGMKMFADKSFDLCFTSPPYFDAEEYADTGTQSWKKYQNYGEWFNEFLIMSIKEAMRICKKVLINIDNTGSYKIADDLRKWLEVNKVNFSEDRLRRPVFGGKIKHEPIFVIRAA